MRNTCVSHADDADLRRRRTLHLRHHPDGKAQASACAHLRILYHNPCSILHSVCVSPRSLREKKISVSHAHLLKNSLLKQMPCGILVCLTQTTQTYAESAHYACATIRTAAYERSNVCLCVFSLKIPILFCIASA